MKILLPYYTRSGCTGKLADCIAQELRSRKHTVVFDRLNVVKRKTSLNLLIRQIYQYPAVGLTLVSKSFRRWWLAHHFQPEDDIRPPAFPDVSEYDHICIGGPKWCYISYPVARYLKQVKGLKNQTVSTFATFGGPPLKRFEFELIFKPMNDRIRNSDGSLVACLGLSSNFHELKIIWIFRLVSWIFFRQPLKSFTIDSDYGKKRIRKFCDQIEAKTTAGTI